MAEHLTKKDFIEKVFDYENNKEWKYRGDLPSIIDFYADWCGPCKMISPVLEELSKEYEGKVHVYKVNTEEEQELSAAFGIQSIPTLIFIPMEGDPRMAQGALPKDALKNIMKDVLKVA
jgi:thioredoxin